MKPLRTLLISCTLIFSFLILHHPAAAEPTVHIGVLAKRGPAKAIAQWGQTADYLSQKLKRPFKIVPLKFAEIEPALKANKIHFLLANPAFFARLEEKYNLKAINTMLNRRLKNGLDRFGGVVFARKDSDIKDLKDVRGKKFMCVKYTSFGGAHMAWRLLLESGINPKKDFAAFLEGGTHDNVVMAVKKGRADAGTVRTDTLERMASEGKIRMEDFKIINQVRDSFKFVHSTRLYPEWPMAVCSKTDVTLSRSVAKALYLLPSTHPAMRTAKVYGWIRPLNYSDVTSCLRVIGLL